MSELSRIADELRQSLAASAAISRELLQTAQRLTRMAAAAQALSARSANPGLRTLAVELAAASKRCRDAAEYLAEAKQKGEGWAANAGASGGSGGGASGGGTASDDSGGSCGAAVVPNLHGMSLADAETTVLGHGFTLHSQSKGGYRRYVHADGSNIYIRPNGEVQRLGPKIDAGPNQPNYRPRYGPDGRRTDAHSTGEMVNR